MKLYATEQYTVKETDEITGVFRATLYSSIKRGNETVIV